MRTSRCDLMERMRLKENSGWEGNASSYHEQKVCDRLNHLCLPIPSMALLGDVSVKSRVSRFFVPILGRVCH